MIIKMYKKLFYIFFLFFIGCGNADNEDSTITTISGKTVDGYIKNAKVCIDSNNNLKCDENEINTITNKNGEFNITTKRFNNQLIIAKGGFDTDRDEEFNSTLIGIIKDKKAILTPITTFNYFYAKNNNKSFDEAKNEVSHILGISNNDINKDPMKKNYLKKLSLKLELLSEIAASFKSEKPINIFDELASNSLNDSNLSTIIEDTFNNPNIKISLNYMLKEIDNEKNISNIKNIKNLVINTTLNAEKNKSLVTLEILNNNANPIYALTKNILSNLKYTQYRHYRDGYVISKDKLFIDCSGFVNYIIDSINSELYSKMLQKSTYSCYSIKAADYVNFAKNDNFNEFKLINSVKDIKKGDIIAYKLNDGIDEIKCKNGKTVYLTKCLEYDNDKCVRRANTGHVFIALDTPKKQDNKWILKIADSTTYLHQNDSRANSVTQNGVGYGDIFLHENYILIKGNQIPILILRMK